MRSHRPIYEAPLSHGMLARFDSMGMTQKIASLRISTSLFARGCNLRWPRE